MSARQEEMLRSAIAFIVICLLKSVSSCGILTHIEISHRAQEYFKDESHSAIDYGELILKHQDALVAGSPYPDSFYDTICAGGKYHYVSEDTHWAPFLNVSVNYIRKNLPQPWDEATEKLVVFLFGVVSHQVADILWHSLGIDQGFLATMGKINFHGSFDAAHPIGDFGGDVLSSYEFPLDYLSLTEGWYIPTTDLYNIYKEYYNNTSPISKEAIVECAGETLFERLAEIVGAQELFPEIAYESPYLVDQFEKYFIGGIDDMAGWTNRIWQQTITMLEKGTSVCKIPKSTLFLDCQGTPPNSSPGNRYPEKNGYYYQRPLQDFTAGDIIVEKYLRGVRVKPSQQFIDRMLKKQEHRKEVNLQNKKKLIYDQGPVREPNHVLYVKNAYAKLGEAYATGDLNFDGKPDLVVTAPGYGSPDSPQEGRVYIVYGGDDGITTETSVDLDSLLPHQAQIVKGWGTAQARLGMSVAVVDVNLDGADDLAVGGPSFVMTFSGDATPLDYQGYVMIYFGNPKKHEVARGAANITIFCQKFRYCNLGFSMAAGDVNNDGYPDLVFGSPFAPEGGEQRGFVAALISSKHNYGYTTMDVTDLKWKKSGTQDYGWFGYDFFFYNWFNRNHMFVSQPEYRICKNPSCSYSLNDTQSTGRLIAYDLGPSPQRQPWHIDGTKEFQQTGWSAAAGKTIFCHMLAIGDLGYDVEAKLAGVPVPFPQSGRVRVYNISSDNPVMRSTFEGDRMFGRFGGKVKFFDVNNDTYDDLLIGAAYRSDDVTEEIYKGEQGLVVIYYGGKTFPLGDGTADCGNSFIHPCPRYTAFETLTWFNEAPQTRFGTNMEYITFKNKRQLFVTAEHDSTHQRLAGAIGIFDY